MDDHSNIVSMKYHVRYVFAVNCLSHEILDYLNSWDSKETKLTVQYITLEGQSMIQVSVIVEAGGEDEHCLMTYFRKVGITNLPGAQPWLDYCEVEFYPGRTIKWFIDYSVETPRWTVIVDGIQLDVHLTSKLDCRELVSALCDTLTTLYCKWESATIEKYEIQQAVG